MRISVKAKPKSKQEFVKRIDSASFVVAVKEAAEKGRANQAIIEALAKFFEIPSSSVILISGQTSRQKIFEVPIPNQVEMPF